MQIGFLCAPKRLGSLRSLGKNGSLYFCSVDLKTKVAGFGGSAGGGERWRCPELCRSCRAERAGLEHRNALIMQPPCPHQPNRLLSALGERTNTKKKPAEVPLSATDSGCRSVFLKNLNLFL